MDDFGRLFEDFLKVLTPIAAGWLIYQTRMAARENRKLMGEQNKKIEDVAKEVVVVKDIVNGPLGRALDSKAELAEQIHTIRPTAHNAEVAYAANLAATDHKAVQEATQMIVAQKVAAEECPTPEPKEEK